MLKKKTPEEFIFDARKVHGEIDSVLSRPDLMSEWDVTNNIGLEPSSISLGSHVKASWICSICGHHWQTEIRLRAKGSGCPVCSGRLPRVGINDFKSTHPDLLQEWDYEANFREGISPESITERSGKKVHWICKKCGNRWITTPDKRVSGRGCPECAKAIQSQGRIDKFISYKGNLADNNPELLEEWDYEKNSELDPRHLTDKSNKTAYWICKKCGYKWKSIIANRAKGVGCPVCSGRVTVKGINDLGTTHPSLLLDWNYVKNGNHGLSPFSVSKGSEKKAFWKCHKCGHEWKACIYSRAAGVGCPNCASELSTSFPEQSLFFYVSQIYSDAINGYKPLWLSPSEIDIFLPSISIGIEYDGAGYHKSPMRDIQKDSTCKKHGIRLLHVREPGCPELPASSWTISRNTKRVSSLDEMVLAVFKELNILDKAIEVKIDTEKDKDKIYGQYLTKIKANSIAKYPLAMFYWDWEANRGIDPNMVSAGSNMVVHWVCPTCGFTWTGRVADRTRKGRGCPVCSKHVLWRGHNDLESCNPHLARQWDYEKNSLLPSDVTQKSSKLVWWKCPECNGSWRATVYNRSNGTGCPYCSGKKVLKGFNDLLTLDPILASEWHPTLNAFSPDCFTRGSNKVVWWQCSSCGYEWQESINSRLKKRVCPNCKRHQSP